MAFNELELERKRIAPRPISAANSTSAFVCKARASI
jgi:hypothetical protein